MRVVVDQPHRAAHVVQGGAAHVAPAQRAPPRTPGRGSAPAAPPGSTCRCREGPRTATRSPGRRTRSRSRRQRSGPQPAPTRSRTTGAGGPGSGTGSAASSTSGGEGRQPVEAGPGRVGPDRQRAGVGQRREDVAQRDGQQQEQGERGAGDRPGGDRDGDGDHRGPGGQSDGGPTEGHGAHRAAYGVLEGRALGVHRDQRGVRGLPLAQLVAGGHDLLHQGRHPAPVAQVRGLGDPGAVASEQSGEGADTHEQGEHGAGLRGPPPASPAASSPTDSAVTTGWRTRSRASSSESTSSTTEASRSPRRGPARSAPGHQGHQRGVDRGPAAGQLVQHDVVGQQPLRVPEHRPGDAEGPHADDGHHQHQHGRVRRWPG